jgi:hypothetical protein
MEELALAANGFTGTLPKEWAGMGRLKRLALL